MPEHPLPGLAAGPLGVLDARLLGERRRLPLAGARQLLDLRLQRRDRGGLLEDQGDQLIAPQLGELGFRHDGNVGNRTATGQGSR
jgi:hypothetical protein